VIEENVLYGFLEKLNQEALLQIKREGKLTQENALPFLIKDQYSKISLIEKEFATRGELEVLRDEVHELRRECMERFEHLIKLIIWGFAAQSSLIALLGFGLYLK